MQAEELLANRQSDWQALSEMLTRSQNSLRQLSPEEIRELGRLYRAATSDLALAQRDFPDHPVTQYLNQLVARAHAAVYRGEPLALRRFFHFIVAGFPRAYRQAWPFMLTATLCFIIPAILAGVSIAMHPVLATYLLPPELQEVISMIEEQELWTTIPVAERPFTSTFIMQNNIQVSLLAFSTGVLGGVFTVWVLLMNGLILGGVLGLTTHYGIGLDLLTFVIGHGVIELSVIFIAGGAGLMLGWAVLHPGLLRRRDALAQAAARAVRLVVGGIPLLIMAGFIEGFISPAENIPWWVKWGVGILTGVTLYSYLLLSGRKRN